ncbi:hypothetical protein ACWKSP_22345 [Micromonosporaceae bacterium Da 78-11]
MSRRDLACTGTTNGTDQQRLTAVLDALTQHGVAHWFDLRGATGVLEGRYDDYTRAGVDRWVGEHVGMVDNGGAYWDRDGVLRYRGSDNPVERMRWSWNHELPELAELLVRLFTEQGFDAYWLGEDFDSVVVTLGDDR